MGVTPGVHFSVSSRYHTRRVTMNEGAKLPVLLMEKGYRVEPSSYSEGSWVVEFPVDMGPNVVSEDDVDLWEQIHVATLTSEHWADNNPSFTAKFDPAVDTPETIEKALKLAEGKLKAISFLSKSQDTYAQMPYESITPEHYAENVKNTERVEFEGAVYGLHDLDDRFCDGDKCEVAPTGEVMLPA